MPSNEVPHSTTLPNRLVDLQSSCTDNFLYPYKKVYKKNKYIKCTPKLINRIKKSDFNNNYQTVQKGLAIQEVIP